jgi:hypothetical protein
MYSFTKHQPQPDIRLQSSLAEISEKLHGLGVLTDTSDPVENIMFRTHVLEPHISQMSHIHQVLRQLDVDSKMRGASTSCAKAQHARAWMAQEHGGAPDLTWAIMGLAIARHTACDCHETGSLQPGRRTRRARLNSRPSFFDSVLAFFRAT